MPVDRLLTDHHHHTNMHKQRRIRASIATATLHLLATALVVCLAVGLLCRLLCVVLDGARIIYVLVSLVGSAVRDMCSAIHTSSRAALQTT